MVKNYDNDEVLKLCEELCNCKFKSIEKMIKDNSFYAELYPLENDYKITLKCDTLLAELYRKQYPNDIIKGYHCPPIQAMYRNTIYINKSVNDELIYEMIDHSCDEVIKSFPKKIQKEILF